VRKATSDDVGRGGEATAAAGPKALFAGMFERLNTDRLWAGEYQDYVRRVSCADVGELIGFDQALAAVRDLVALTGTERREGQPKT